MNDSIKIEKRDKLVIILRDNVELDILSFHRFGLELTQILEKESGLQLIYNASKVDVDIPGEVKLAMGMWLKDNESLLKEKVICAAAIMPSFVTQMVLMAVLAIKNPEINYKVFHSEENALDWINKYS